MNERTPAELAKALEGVLRSWLTHHPETASSIAVIADWIGSLAREVGTQAPQEKQETSSRTQPSGSQTDTEAAAASSAASPQARPAPTAFVPLKLGDQVMQIKVPGTSADIAAARKAVFEQSQGRSEERSSLPDLKLIAERCELKVRTCEAAIRKVAAQDEADIESATRQIAELLEQRKHLPDCFLWMVFPGREQPAPAVLDTIRSCYANLAKAARILLRVPPEHPLRRASLQLMAEAQSALRIVLSTTWLTSPDIDQDQAFIYLTHATKYESVYLPRFMRLDDGADPHDWANLAERLAAMERALDNAEKESKRVTSLLNKLAFHARKISSGAQPEEEPYDWERIELALEELATLGVPGQDDRVRSRLASLREHPDLAAHSLAAAALRPRVEPEADSAPAMREYSADVERVRAMLEGSRVVLVGGEPREESRRRIEEAFGLGELEWVSVPEHTSSAPLEAPIRRADTRLVMILIKLAGHQHVDDVTRWCDQYGKPLVRLPAGYNPERIAADVLEQVSHRLDVLKEAI
jgi:hypothetical protein